MKRNPISILTVAKSLNSDEIKLNRYQQIEREMLGIYDYIDDNHISNENFRLHTKAFDSYEDYYKARTKAELLINDGKPVPEALRCKLIQAKEDLKNKI